MFGLIQDVDFNRDTVVMPYIGEMFDLAGNLAFVVIVIHLIWQCRLSRKWRYITSVTLIAVYVASYSVMSCCGGYHASRSGLLRLPPGLAVIDQKLWHPRGVFWQPFIEISGKQTYQATLLGYFHSPLIRLDRAYVHTTISLFTENS